MKRFGFLTLTGLATVCMSIPVAHAYEDTADYSKGADFTAHHAVETKPYDSYVEDLSAEEKLQVREYVDYELREPCQFYQPIPEGFKVNGCSLIRVEPQKVAMIEEPKPEPVKPMKTSKVLTDYEVHFDFDSSKVKPEAEGTIEQVAREIQQYSPSEVTIAGHADKAGPSDYNIQLSQKRAEAISEELTNRGVANRIIDREAYGEMRPAVDTRDGVALQENRRVVIEFRK